MTIRLIALPAVAVAIPTAVLLGLTNAGRASAGPQSIEQMSAMESRAPAATAIDPDDLEFFESKIRPVLVEHCYGCHSADARRLRGDFSLDTRDSIRRGGPSGAAIVPGDPDASLLIKAVRYEDDFEMPPDEQLPRDVIADLERWVRNGASDPRGVTEAVVETHLR